MWINDDIDENLTIKEVRKQINEANELKESLNLQEYENTKSVFKNTYLKFIYECRFFGKSLNVIHIDEIINKGQTTDYDNIYFVSGSKLAFSNRDIGFRNFKTNDVSDSFTLKELQEMTKITKQEYNEYFDIYSKIKNELFNLIL